MRNIKLLIQYDGTDFFGWQRQPNARTIQGELERCISTITQKPVNLTAASRTDRGVHAFGQVANFKTGSSVSLERLLRGINSMLYPEVSIIHIEEVDDGFDSRRDARRKTYVYKIWNSHAPSPIHHRYSWFFPQNLDIDSMREAARCLVGIVDFSSFVCGGSIGKNPQRRCFKADLYRNEDEMVLFEITADAFLRNMVRSIMGTLVDVGIGKITPSQFEQIVRSKQRVNAGRTLPPEGLFLLNVEY